MNFLSTRRLFFLALLLLCLTFAHSHESGSEDELMEACKQNRIEDVERLIEEEHVDPNFVSKIGLTPLMFAAVNGNLLTAAYLVNAAHVDVNKLNPYTKQSALMLASSKGHIPMVKLLVEHRALVDLRGRKDDTSLTLAIVNQHSEIAMYLLDKGAGVNQQDAEGFNALMSAIRGKLPAVALKMLTRKPPSGFVAVKGGDAQFEDINVIAADSVRGWTPLIGASYYGFDEVVQELLKRNEVKVDAAEKTGYTALMMAAREGYPSTLRLLLNAGADVDRKEKTGLSALMIGAQTGFPLVCQLLVAYKANPDLKDNKGLTALDLARQFVAGDEKTLANFAARRLRDESKPEVSKCSAGYGGEAPPGDIPADHPPTMVIKRVIPLYPGEARRADGDDEKLQLDWGNLPVQDVRCGKQTVEFLNSMQDVEVRKKAQSLGDEEVRNRKNTKAEL